MARDETHMYGATNQEFATMEALLSTYPNNLVSLTKQLFTRTFPQPVVLLQTWRLLSSLAAPCPDCGTDMHAAAAMHLLAIETIPDAKPKRALQARQWSSTTVCRAASFCGEFVQIPILAGGDTGR